MDSEILRDPSNLCGDLPHDQHAEEPVLFKNDHRCCIGRTGAKAQVQRDLAWQTRRVRGPWFPSSKQCSRCGEVVSELPLSTRTWECPTCHHRHDRDVNAALNIKAAGLSASACGGLRKTGEWSTVASEAGCPFLQGMEQLPTNRSFHIRPASQSNCPEKLDIRKIPQIHSFRRDFLN